MSWFYDLLSVHTFCFFFNFQYFVPPPIFAVWLAQTYHIQLLVWPRQNYLTVIHSFVLARRFPGPDVSCSVTLLLSINLSGLEISSLAWTDQIQLLGKDKTTSQLSIYLSGPDVSLAQTFLILTTAFQTLPQN